MSGLDTFYYITISSLFLGNAFTARIHEFWSYITNDAHDRELVSRNKRITVDDNFDEVLPPPSDPLEYAKDGEKINVLFAGKSFDDVKREEIPRKKQLINERVIDSIINSEQEKSVVPRNAEDDALIYEQRATFRQNSDSRSGRSEVSVSSHKKKDSAKKVSKRPKMTIKTVSSVSVPALSEIDSTTMGPDESESEDDDDDSSGSGDETPLQEGE